MYYHIINGIDRVIEQQNRMDESCNKFTCLNDIGKEAMLAFYLANPTASVSEIQNCALVVHVATLEETKAKKLNNFYTSLYPVIMSGYFDVETGFTLGLLESDYMKFTALKSGIMDLPDDMPQKFGLKDVGSETLPVLDLKELLKRYFLYLKPVWDKQRDVEDAVILAQTIEDVNNITW